MLRIGDKVGAMVGDVLKVGQVVDVDDTALGPRACVEVDGEREWHYQVEQLKVMDFFEPAHTADLQALGREHALENDAERVQVEALERGELDELIGGSPIEQQQGFIP